MSFQAIQQLSGQTMVTQSARLGLAAEALSYVNIPASSPESVLQPDVPIIRPSPTPMSISINQKKDSVSAFAAEVAQVVKSNTPPTPRYQPGHPLANDDGQVFYPNVSHLEVMADMMSAARDFDAAVSIFNTSKQMQDQVLELISL